MPKPELKAGERKIASYRANRVQGNRAVGGALLLTDERVAFYPHWFDRTTGGRPWEVPLDAVSQVGVAPRGSDPAGRNQGSARRRLRITCGDIAESFVVNKVEEIASAIDAARSL
jgi:hypothetical protein